MMNNLLLCSRTILEKGSEMRMKASRVSEDALGAKSRGGQFDRARGCLMEREREADHGKAGGRRSSGARASAMARATAVDGRDPFSPALPWPFVPPHMQPSCVLSLRAAFSLLPVAGEAKSALSAHLSSLDPPCAGTLCPPVRKNVRFLATKPRSGTVAARFRFKSAPLHSESPGKRFRQARCVFKTSLIRARNSVSWPKIGRFACMRNACGFLSDCVRARSSRAGSCVLVALGSSIGGRRLGG